MEAKLNNSSEIRKIYIFIQVFWVKTDSNIELKTEVK